jgi:hypothetical protein
MNIRGFFFYQGVRFEWHGVAEGVPVEVDQPRN